MSSITYDATLNTKPLDQSIKDSTKTVDEWAKKVEKSGEKVDQAFVKTNKSFKDAIKDQKDLIKSIESDVKKLEKAFESASPGTAKRDALADLKAAKRSLAEEQGTLIGLQKQQIEANNKEADSTEGIIGKLKGWVLGLASVGAALKIAKNIIASTETTQLAFERAVAGASAGVQYFFKSIASGDWSNFWQGMDRAIEGARTFVDEMEHIQNLRNEQRIKSTKYDVQIAELRLDTFDREDHNDTKRLENLTKIIDLTKRKYKEEAELQDKTYRAELKNAAAASGLQEGEIQDFITKYSSLEKMMKVGERYLELTSKLNRSSVLPVPGQSLSTKNIDADIQKEIDALGDGAEEAAKYVERIGKIPQATKDALSQSKAAAIEAQSKSVIGSRRDEMQKAALEAKMAKDAEDARKQAIEDAKIENQLKKEQEKQSEAIDKGDQAQIDASAIIIANLQRQLDLRKKIAEDAILTAQLGGRSGVNSAFANGIDISGVVTPLTNFAPGNVEKQKRDMLNLHTYGAKLDKEKYDKIKKFYDDEETRKKRILELTLEITASTHEMVNSLSELTGVDNETAQFLNRTMSAIGEAISGNYIQAALQMLSGMFEMLPTRAEKVAVEIKRMNDLLQEQQRLVELSIRAGGEKEARAAELDQLKKQWEYMAAQQAYWEHKVEHSAGGIFYGKRKREAEEWAAASKEAQKAYEDALQAYEDFLAGGVTQETIADSIAKGFQESKNSVDDFADYMNQILTDAALSVFKKEILGESITNLSADIAKALSDEKLTAAEKQSLVDQYNEIVNQKKKLWEDLTGALDLTGNEPAGLTGGIMRQITEETGSEIAGLMRRLTDDVRANRDYNKMGINHLIGIEQNTYNTVLRLDSAIVELKNIVNNTKPVYSGDL